MPESRVSESLPPHIRRPGGHGDQYEQTRNVTAILRLHRLPARPGEAHRCPAFRPGCLRHHAHRRRQEPVLPGAGAYAAGGDIGHLPPDFSHEGPGHGPEGRRSQRGLHQFLPDTQPDPPGVPEHPERYVQDHLCGPGAASDRRLLRGHPVQDRFPGDGRRGPLHFPVGPGFPAQLPENRGLSEGLPQPARGLRLYGHGHGPGPGGH